MMVSKEEFTKKCNKPAVTFHCKNDYTLSVAAVAIVSTIILFHLCVFKMSSCRKRKLKEAKMKLKEKKHQSCNA